MEQKETKGPKRSQGASSKGGTSATASPAPGVGHAQPGAATTLPPAPVLSPSLTSSAESEPGPLGAVKHLQSRLAIALLNAVRSLAH